eukprot:10440514-Prorocentrum_lima.AAC.1
MVQVTADRESPLIAELQPVREQFQLGHDALRIQEIQQRQAWFNQEITKGMSKLKQWYTQRNIGNRKGH